MTTSPISRSSDVREATGRQLRTYRLIRRQSAVDQRRLLAAQAAELRALVAATLTDLGANLASAAEAQREHLETSVAAMRCDVANLLQALAAERHAHAAVARCRQSQELCDLREQVARLLYELNARRSERAASQSLRLHAERQALARDVASLLSALRAEHSRHLDQHSNPQPVQSSGTAQRIGRAGIVAYVQMARVSILRAFESGVPGEAQLRQIGTHLDGLVGSVQPFLIEASASLDQLNPADREQLSKAMAGVYCNIVALIHEFEAAPCPTASAQRQAFQHLVEDVQCRLSPLRDALAIATHTLQGDEPARPEYVCAVVEPEPPPVRSYRDNLTTIHGIGPALQQRLDRAGICTYIQLALSNPEELRKALGEAGRLANVEDWIVQARSLAGMPD